MASGAEPKIVDTSGLQRAELAKTVTSGTAFMQEQMFADANRQPLLTERQEQQKRNKNLCAALLSFMFLLLGLVMVVIVGIVNLTTHVFHGHIRPIGSIFSIVIGSLLILYAVLTMISICSSHPCEQQQHDTPMISKQQRLRAMV